jgi:hypothetical protein
MALFGRSSKKSKSSGPAYVRPPEPVSVQANLSALSYLTPWREAAGSAAVAAANRAGQAPSGILAALQQRAMQGLQAGGDLSAEEARAASQGAAAEMQARGIRGAPSVLAGVLARAGAATARRQQREAFAASVAGMENQQQQLDLATLNGTTGAALGGLDFSEDTRRFGINRADTLSANENNFTMDKYTADKNASAAKSAGRSSMMGNIIGSIISKF